MKDAVYKISLDIHEHGSQTAIKAKNTDTGRKLFVSLRSGGTPYIIEDDCYAVFKATKPDGTILYNACTIENNEIIYEFTSQTCAAVGRCRCEIALYGLDDKLITSPRFMLLVDGTIYPDDVVESTDEFSALTGLVGDTLKSINEATEAAKSANESAESANNAKNDANQAAESASQAATAATQATQNANTATGNANTATKNANEATNRANEAAQAANNATSSVSQATERANEATNNATLAADNANKAANQAAHTAKSLMVVGEAKGEVITLDDAIDQFLVGLRVFGKTTQAGTPTPDAPVELVSVGDGGSICVTVSGKNVFKFAGNIVMENGSVIESTPSGCTVQGVDGGVTPGSTAWSNGRVHFDRMSAMHLTKGAVITLSADYTVLEKHPSAGEKVVILLEQSSGVTNLDISKAEIGVKHQISKTFVISNDGKYKRTTFSTHSSKVKIENVQWEIGEVVSDFVPYKEQTLSISTPNGLPGIPVTSGGNYTDANGQQWICDEIDLSRGVYVRRVTTEVSDGSTDEAWDYNASMGVFRRKFANMKSSNYQSTLCDKYLHGTTTSGLVSGQYWSRNSYYGDRVIAFKNYNFTDKASWVAHLAENPITVLYELETPIETPLSEEELAAYASLHTYRDHTTVSNDASAYMELEYVMDAKKYIDSLVGGGIATARVE